MDRLAESSRPALPHRAEANDFTRTEHRETVEARADLRLNERERQERAHAGQERFSLHLEEQKASLEPQAGVEPPAETQPTQGAEQNAEEADIEPAAQSGQANATAPKTTGNATDAQLTPKIEGPILEISAAAPTESSTPLPIAQPIALPVVTNAVQPTIAPTPGEVQPAIAIAPRLATEKSALEVESSTTKLGAPRADNTTNQVQNPAHNREASTEAFKVEAPREAPPARSVHEVERAADILRQIRVQISPQLSEARIQLHPIELGRVSIHLMVEDGRMKTIVRAEKSETLQAIQTHLPELRASLRQHGIDAQDFQLMLGFEHRERRDGDNAPSPSNTRTAAAEMPAIERSPSLHAAVTQTGVDFYA